MTAPPIDPALSSPDMQRAVQELFGPDALAPGQSPDESKANQIASPNPPDDQDLVEPIARYRSLMAALYGSDFPLLNAFDQLTSQNPQYEATGTMPTLQEMLPLTGADEWAKWTRGCWSSGRSAVEMHLYLIARNRLFRSGQQWVSSKGREPWREPARPAEAARVVHNLIAPALDQRMQVITEQRPSFQVDPTSMSPDEKRKAEGRQQALEYQFDQQKMEQMTREAAYWAGTDGVSFWEVYWDRDAGPWDERMGNVPDQKKPLGDLRTKVRRCEQVRVSPNATATQDPYWQVVRDVIAESEAAHLYGVSGVQERATTGDIAGHGDSDTSGSNADGIMPSWVLTQTIVGEGNRLNNVKTVERFTMYVDKHPDVLPDGLQLVVLGNSVVWGPGDLLFGCCPVIPVRDGTTDPSYFPRPIMEQWIAPQMRINAALSLWVNSVRVNSGGRFLAKPDAISRETFIGSGLSLIEVESPGSLNDVVLPVQGFLVGEDVKDLIAFDVKAFEDMSGYNDVSRGQISNETATAVAAANEHIQRVFAPPVEAVARAYEQWATVNLAGMAWGYDIPRDVGAVGSERPDLARSLSAKDFDGPSTVRVEAAKLLPMPKVYRLQILDDWFNRGLINAQQYMRNVQFGSFQNLATPDEDQEARAKRIADALRQGQQIPGAPPPADPNDPNSAQVTAQAAAQPMAIRWQDNESIHQDVLEREILLQDDLDPSIVAQAAARWKALADQAAQKKGAPAPNTPDATFQQFTSDVTSKAIAASASFVAKEVSTEMGLVAPPAVPGAPPAQGAPAVMPPHGGHAGPPPPGQTPPAVTPPMVPGAPGQGASPGGPMSVSPA